MAPRQKALVRTTFDEIVPIAETAAAIFYTRLFELDPSLRPMFSINLDVQGRKLMEMIAAVVHGLDDIEALMPTVRALGKRHAGYGVQDDRYETVAVALLSTLELGLRAALTAEVREARETVYLLLADTMRAGATSHCLIPRHGN